MTISLILFVVEPEALDSRENSCLAPNYNNLLINNLYLLVNFNVQLLFFAFSFLPTRKFQFCILNLRNSLHNFDVIARKQ